MKTETILIIILIVLIVAVIAVVMMNQGTREVEELRDEIKELKKSEVASELEELRSEIKDLKENQVDEPEPVVEDVEDDIVYLKSAATVDVQSPDIVKKKISIQSDENRASVMESQNIVENDVKKKSEESDAKIAPRVMSKGPDSMKLSPIFMEKLQSAARKVKEQERNEEIKRGVDRARHTGPMPSPELIRMGPPKMVRPAVCRDLPGSPFDSCGRPSSFGPVLPVTRVQV
jgi:hypothetical protein